MTNANPTKSSNTEAKQDITDTEKEKPSVDTKELETAVAKAEQLEAALDALDEGGNLAEVYSLIADLAEAVYKSGAFQSAKEMYDQLPSGIRKALMGEGPAAIVMNNTSVSRPVVEAFRGLAQSGMIDAPKGIDPALFTQDNLQALKMAKWLLVIGAFLQPELAPLQALIPLVEKLIVKYDQLTGFVKARITLISANTREKANAALGNLNDHRPTDNTPALRKAA